VGPSRRSKPPVFLSAGLPGEKAVIYTIPSEDYVFLIDLREYRINFFLRIQPILLEKLGDAV